MLNQKGLPWNCGLGVLFLEFLLLLLLWFCDVIAIVIKLLARNENALNKVACML
jgi:hypothetical protein